MKFDSKHYYPISLTSIILTFETLNEVSLTNNNDKDIFLLIMIKRKIVN